MSSETMLSAPVFSESLPGSGTFPVLPHLFLTTDQQMGALVSLWQTQNLRLREAGCCPLQTDEAPNHVRNAFPNVKHLAGGRARVPTQV